EDRTGHQSTSQFSVGMQRCLFLRGISLVDALAEFVTPLPAYLITWLESEAPCADAPSVRTEINAPLFASTSPQTNIDVRVSAGSGDAAAPPTART
ncbi:MAG: hypothetical protein AABZ02_02715, partial [Bacteroidota bacterium]